mgnify:CR=1 FL=1
MLRSEIQNKTGLTRKAIEYYEDKGLINPHRLENGYKDSILQYESYKNSEQYQNSLLRDIQEKLRKYMIDNNYYQVAIPLIRKVSKSYNMYYEKMIKANERFMNIKNV